MRQLLGAALVLLVMAGPARWLAGDEANDLYIEIKTAAEKTIDVKGKSREEISNILKEFCSGVMTLCDKYIKEYPEGREIADVLYYKAQAYYFLARTGDIDKNFAAAIDCARQAQAKADPKTDVAKQASLLIVQTTAYRDNVEELAREIEYLAKIAPGSEELGRALAVLASIYEKKEQPDKAVEVYERMVKEVPETKYGQRAKGQLAKRKLMDSQLELSFTSVDGRKVDIRDYRGKVVLVDFWASWCGPCKAEMPRLVEAYRTYNTRGFEIIGVSLDQKKEDMDDYMKKAGMSWPQYFDGKAWENEVSTRFGVDSIPFTILVDKKGKVRALSLRGAALVTRVRELLGEAD